MVLFHIIFNTYEFIWEIECYSELIHHILCSKIGEQIPFLVSLFYCSTPGLLIIIIIIDMPTDMTTQLELLYSWSLLTWLQTWLLNWTCFVPGHYWHDCRHDYSTKTALLLVTYDDCSSKTALRQVNIVMTIDVTTDMTTQLGLLYSR